MSNKEKSYKLTLDEKEIKVAMVKANSTSNDSYDLSDEYSFQYYQEGDREAWAKIQYEAKQFSSVKAALNRFDNEFGNHLELLKKRLLFVVDKKGSKVATTMMWFMLDSNQSVQRLHWVAVEPAHQGQGIAHAMLKKILGQYQSSERIYLTTQVKNYRAISIYYKFGFIPYPFKDIKKFANVSLEKIKNSPLETKELKKAWKLINLKINKK